MAANYQCDYCESNPADFMIGMLANGDQTAVCRYCVPAWTKALTDALGQLDQAPTEALEAPQAPVMDGGEDWEDDYPQGRSDEPTALTVAEDGFAYQEAEKATASDVDR